MLRTCTDSVYCWTMLINTRMHLQTTSMNTLLALRSSCLTLSISLNMSHMSTVDMAKIIPRHTHKHVQTPQTNTTPLITHIFISNIKLWSPDYASKKTSLSKNARQKTRQSHVRDHISHSRILRSAHVATYTPSSIPTLTSSNPTPSITTYPSLSTQNLCHVEKCFSIVIPQ